MSSSADSLLNPDGLIAAARAGLERGDETACSLLLPAIAASHPRTAAARPETVAAIRELLLNEKFLALDGSWNLLHFLLQNWRWLSQDQMMELRESIADSFDRFSHWMGSFVAGEILGSCLCDAWSMNRLETLSKSARMPAKGLVPHGLESLAKATQVPELRERALAVLRELTGDQEPAVRDEACALLGKLERVPSPG